MLFNKEWDKKFPQPPATMPALPKAPKFADIDLTPGGFNFVSYDEAASYSPPDFVLHGHYFFKQPETIPAPMYMPDGRRVADLLRFAASVLECSGWCQGTAIDKSGRRCAGEAIAYAAMHDHIVRERAMQAMCRYVNCVSIPSWNDQPGRTAKDVIAAFRHCANLVDREYAVL